MTIKVLVVDDSHFFCRRICQILSSDPDIQIVGMASNGAEAVKKAAQLKPDVITMDVEMPVMDGITALKQIMQETPTAVMMLSSLTYDGARLTLDALEAGAADFMLKSYNDVSPGNNAVARQLIDKVKSLGQSQPVKSASQAKPASPAHIGERNQVQQKVRAAQPARPLGKFQNNFKLLAIGASTGGPVAVQEILKNLPSNFPVPITITVHMPANFTPAFANRLNSVCPIRVVEAADGMRLEPGVAYVAPGAKQMYLEGNPASARVRIRPHDPRIQYAPSVDVTFASAARLYGREVLAIVLTGMGADGRDGARLIRQQGGKVWAQDAATCVVYGMPMAVATAGLADRQLPLPDIANQILRVA